MVKGNWQHRVEKAERRKAERKERKELREKGLLVEPLDVLNALFRGDPDPEVWLVAPERPKLCAAHFFGGGCTNRRCKWSRGDARPVHRALRRRGADGTTARAVARLARVDEQLFPSSVAPAARRHCRKLRAASLASGAVVAAKRRGRPALLLTRQRSLLRRAKDVAYAASGAALAFDAGADDVWRSFAGGAAPRPRAVARRLRRGEARRAPSSAAVLDALVSSERPFRALLACCPDASAAGLAAGSKALRAAAKADPAILRAPPLPGGATAKQGKKKKQGKSRGQEGRVRAGQ
ncbi:hypothetical protein JL721_11466 [Aureococcus anophagefferens]|nr:hypothetical protein JL721_11466 [Aureococcus anophagefferens]